MVIKLICHDSIVLRYMNEDSGVMIVRTRYVCISELLLCCTPGTAIEYSHV